jgi:hypothetical protein
MTLSARLQRLEARRLEIAARAGRSSEQQETARVAAALEALSDDELDRLEAAFVRIAAATDLERLPLPAECDGDLGKFIAFLMDREAEYIEATRNLVAMGEWP